MDSPQSVVSPFKNSFEKQNNLFVENAGCLSRENGVQGMEPALSRVEDILGVLQVHVYQARDIHNICIYHKQDVYAKLCLTNDPENSVSTKTINGGGRNPVFDDTLLLKVRNVDSSLKCEIWMLSRVKNYLEDQLLGFALVPVSEVLLSSGKLEKEFSLSSTDLFHSPAGYVHLSLSYSGASPEVMIIPPPSASVHDTEVPEALPGDLDKIQFPDPKIVNEDHEMVSEYFDIPCTNADSQGSDGLVCSDAENQLNSEAGAKFLESFSTCSIDSIQIPKVDSPRSSASTNGAPTDSLPVSTQSSDTPKSSNEEYASRLEGNTKEKKADVFDAESKASGSVADNMVMKPLVSVNIEPEQKVVQQDIVDMYMKSMQQFTESLAKMKLPLDIDSGPASSGDSSSDQKLQTPTKNSGSRVFYGSRAFF